MYIFDVKIVLLCLKGSTFPFTEILFESLSIASESFDFTFYYLDMEKFCTTSPMTRFAVTR